MARKTQLIVGKPTKLSEAILVGMRFKPKATNAFFEGDIDRAECKVTGSCALAAAYEGVHLNPVVNTGKDNAAFMIHPRRSWDDVTRSYIEADPSTDQSLMGTFRRELGVDIETTMVPVPEGTESYFSDYDDAGEWHDTRSEASIYELVTTLNDNAKWSRDRIARYLAKQGY